MKNTTKKITAALVAFLMMIQIIPAMAGTYSSGMIVGGSQGYREELEVVASKGTYVLVGQTLALDVNEGYSVTWSSGDEAIATIDELGLITALAAGEVTITATEGEHSATVVVTVIDPEPMAAAIQQETEKPDQPAEHPDEPGQPEQTAVQKQYMIIVVNAESRRYVYDGEEHTLAEYVATSNDPGFDAAKVRVSGEIGVTARNCGAYQLVLEESSFSYDDPNVAASFVVNNGWMKITPAEVTVTANTASKESGEPDPELTATVFGLHGDDTIDYTLERAPGEAVGEYVIEAAGEEKQGNYRINYVSGRFTINGVPVVTIESSIPAGQPVYAGTKITLKAIAAGFGEAKLTYQWESSPDGENWTTIDGATQQTYTYIILPENAMYRYRVFVNPAD